MWTCPSCGRSFQKNNQDHYCEPVTDIDAYIAAQPEAVQSTLQDIRATIYAAAPDASEKISWQMPTFWQGGNLIHFAAFKKHVGLYPGPDAVVAFADRLKDYRTSKGALQLPLNKPIDHQLITDIVAWILAHHKETSPKK